MSPVYTDRNVPVRTCVGCRRRKPASDMVRYVWDASAQTVVLDSSRKRSGRGAWMCDDPKCQQRAERTRAFNRAFRL
ncbi:YlxR family protein [Gleimia hominis]|uniref:YlxR family protein n=1 Tax=Gleimia hominis TaxID=595468 RepID=UPI0035E428E0